MRCDRGVRGVVVEGRSTVFGTSCNYVVLRLLGMEASHPVAARARKTLLTMGGAVNGPQRAKFWLAA